MLQQHFQFHNIALKPLGKVHVHTIPVLLLSPLLIYDLLGPQLLKPGTSQNEPKPAKTSRNSGNDSKSTKTNPKNCETTQNDPKFQISGNLKFPTCFRYLNFEHNCSNLGILDQNLFNFFALTEFRMFSISKVLNSNLIFIFERFESK